VRTQHSPGRAPRQTRQRKSYKYSRPGAYSAGRIVQTGARSRQGQVTGTDAGPSHAGNADDRREFRPFISGLPLWGEAMFLAAACAILYFVVDQWFEMFPIRPARRELMMFTVTYIAPAAAAVYLVLRWIKRR
jgi:hypothetical protein